MLPGSLGADGAKGAARHSLGLKLEGVFKGERFLMGGVDADYAHEKESFRIFFSAGNWRVVSEDKAVWRIAGDVGWRRSAIRISQRDGWRVDRVVWRPRALANTGVPA